jgi:hypothetical protein
VEPTFAEKTLKEKGRENIAGSSLNRRDWSLASG